MEEESEQKISIGENDNYICELIRNDSIEDFVTYVNQQCIDLTNYFIKKSIFETNYVLQNNTITLIEYAFFFGSLQIIKYLMLNRCELTYSNA